MTSRVVFQEEMEKLNGEVAQMAGLAKDAIVKAVQCVVDRDPSLRPEVERLDGQAYALEQAIEKHCLDVIALHSPVAGDLRTVSTCLKIITDLDRIGRYASDIVEVYDSLQGDWDFPGHVNLTYMAELVVGMVNDATQSFIDRDVDLARGLFARDDVVDALYDSNFRALFTHMIEDPPKIGVGINWILVSRYLERIADHSCNIGERVVYMVTGDRLNPKDRKKAKHNGEAPFHPSDDEPGHSTHDLEEK